MYYVTRVNEFDEHMNDWWGNWLCKLLDECIIESTIRWV